MSESIKTKIMVKLRELECFFASKCFRFFLFFYVKQD